MAKGIDSSSKVVVFITQRYMERLRDPNLNCTLEFNYATKMKTVENIVPVVIEANMLNPRSWKGPLGFLATKVFINMSTEELRESQVNKLIKAISKDNIPLPNRSERSRNEIFEKLTNSNCEANEI